MIHVVIVDLTIKVNVYFSKWFKCKTETILTGGKTDITEERGQYGITSSIVWINTKQQQQYLLILLIVVYCCYNTLINYLIHRVYVWVYNKHLMEEASVLILICQSETMTTVYFVNPANPISCQPHTPLIPYLANPIPRQSHILANLVNADSNR